MDNGSDLLNGETDGFITPRDNDDQRMTYFKHKRSFKRYEIAERRLFTSSPQSRGMITLRKVNLVKLFCDEFLMEEILKSCLTFKDLSDTVRISDNATTDLESSISLMPVNKITDLQEHEASKAHLLNQESDCEVVVNMASLSISKQIPTFGLASQPDIRIESRERELSGSFIQISTLRKENEDCALYDQHRDSVVSSRSVRLKRGVKSNKQTNNQKVVSSKKHSNQTLTISDMSQFISADSNCVSSAGPSDRINEKLSDRNNECTDPMEQLPVNVSVFKIPIVQSKRGKKQKPRQPDPKVNTKVQNSIENISVSSFNDSSFSPVQFTLPPESPQEISVMPTPIVQCTNSELCGQTPVSITELTPIQNSSRVESKRKIKNAKAGVAEVNNIEKSKENCMMETRIRPKTRSAKKHLTQKCHVKEDRKECADGTSQMDILDAVKSNKMSSRIRAARKPEGEKMKDLSENDCNVLECNSVIDDQKSKHVLEGDITIMNACDEKIKCFETNTCEASMDETHGKVLTRKRHGIIKNQVHNDTMKENNVGNRRSQIARKLHKHVTVEQSTVIMANSCGVSIPNEVLASNSNQSDEKLGSNVLLKSKRGFKDIGNRNPLTKPTPCKSQQSNRASFPVLNIGDKRSNSTSQCPQLGDQCVPSEDRKQSEIRSHFIPQPSLSDSKYRNRSKKATSADIQLKEIVLDATENLKMNKLHEVSDVSVCDGQQDEGKLQVVENTSGVKMPQRQLRKRKINMNLTENLNDETLQISVPISTQVKGVKQTKRTTTKVSTDSIQKEHVQTLEKMKKPIAKKKSYPEMAAGNECTSKVKKEVTKRKQSEVVTVPMPDEGRSKKDKVSTSKEPTKLKRAAQLKHSEETRSDTKHSEETRSDTKHSEETRSDTKQASQKFVGAHCSAAGGVSNAVLEAVSMGARAFALFVRNGRTWKLNPLDVKEAEKFKAACKVHGFLPRHILPHGSYLLNCGSSNVDTLQKSRDTLVHELQICEMLGLEMYNFHPGSACGKGTVDECLMTVAESINLAHEKTNSVKTVIENMAGQGRTVGGKFEELKIIIDNVKDKSRIGVCLDTCHAFAAGFDLSSEEGFNECIESFDRIVGLHYLCAMHLNDSKGEVGCHLDRHENIGKGHIGLEGFRCVMNDPRLNNIPMILETPVNDYAKEIKILCDLENV